MFKKIGNLGNFILDLALLQKSELNLLYQLKTICEEEHINYWLNGGSLLGAIKYHGMVPWDDDIDIGMLRSDYDRFVAIVEKRFGSTSRYGIISDLKYNEYGVTWAKFIDHSTKISEDFDFSSGTVFIDIMPFDKVSNHKLTQFTDKLWFHIIDHIIKERCLRITNKHFKYSLLIKMIDLPLNFLTQHWSIQELKQYRYNFITRHSTDMNAIIYMNYASWYQWGYEYVYLDEVSKANKISFSGFQVNIPIKYQEIIKRMYGDIAQTPDETEQKPKHVKAFCELPIDN
ncbi:LicD family protein [Oenococcus sp. UCMA 17063]|nr:LicD family protein [Oenococcus sp. UCMA 17063]